MRLRPATLRSLNLGHTIPLLAILIEVLWAYPYLIWIGGWQVLGWPRLPLGLASAVVLAAAAEIVTRAALARNWSLRRVRFLVLGALTVMIATIMRLELAGGYALGDPAWGQYALDHLSLLAGGLAFGAYLLWRGIAVGRESLSFEAMYQKFLIGLTALIILLVLWGLTAGSGEFRRVLASAGFFIVAYFSAGLIALALTNLQSIREQMLRYEGTSGISHRRWVFLLLSIILAIVAVSLGAVSLFSLDLVALLLHPLNVVASYLLMALGYAVGYPLGIVAAALVYVLRFLFRLLQRGTPPESLTPNDLSDLRQALAGREPQGLPTQVMLVLKWGLVALMVALALFLLARALFRYRKGKAEEEIEEVNESLWSWDAFQSEVRSFLTRLLRWFRRQKLVTALAVSPPLSVAQGEEQTRLFTARELYQGLLWEGRRAGLPRRQADTPYEYGARLKAHISSGAMELEAITEAYVAERYGSMAIASEHLGRLNRLWRSLRSLLRDQEAGEEQKRDPPGG